MPRDYPRTLRVAEQIQRELAELIRVELKDPRVRMATLTEVDVSPDYANARVFFTVMGDSPAVAEAAAGLNHAAGFLRRELAHRLTLRSVPRLQFVHDESVERGVRLSRLIDSVSDAPQENSGKSG
jgi:ribosome-binding factor A